MKFNELIQQFSKQYPQVTLRVDETGVVKIQLSDEQIIYLRNALDDETFFLYAQVGKLPTSAEEKLFCQQRLLEANLFGDGVGKASLAIHNDSSSIILTQTFLTQHTDYAAFDVTYHLFIKYLLYWREELTQHL